MSSPQYGFKASLSGRACPADITVRPAPGMPVPSISLHRPFARFRYGRTTWRCVQINPRLHVPLCGSTSATRETFPTFRATLSIRAVDPTPVGPRRPPVVRAPRYQASSCYERVATHETRPCQQYPTG